MSTTRFRIHHLAIAGILALAALTPACSDDSDDDAADETATTSAEVSDWCDAVRAGTNVVPAEALESLAAQADVAPAELAGAYETLIESMQYSAENPADVAGVAERNAQAAPAFVKITEAAQNDCGITIDLGL